MFLEKSLKNYLDQLASHEPTPGGGSASALVGGLGAGLVSMVCHYTLGNDAFKSVEPEIKEILAHAEALRHELSRLTEADAEVYGKLSAAFKLPKQTEEEKKARTEAVQKALKQASEVPLKIAETCSKTLLLAEKFHEKANPNLISDVGVGVVMLQAALQGAVMNIEVNLKSIKDEEFKVRVRGIYRPFLELGEGIAKLVCDRVAKAIIQ